MPCALKTVNLAAPPLPATSAMKATSPAVIKQNVLLSVMIPVSHVTMPIHFFVNLAMPEP